MDKTEHDNDEMALAPSGDATTDPSVAELEKHVADLAASPHFVPLMGSFRDLLEAERRRNRLRTLILGGGTVLVLALFIWGPLHMMRTYIEQSEQRMTAERQSLERVERALNESMSVLATASRDLRTTLEAYRQTPRPAGAPSPAPSAVPAKVPAIAAQASLTAPVVMPAAIIPQALPATTPASIPVAVMPATGKVVTATIVTSVTNTPGPIATVPPDLFRALSSTPTAPLPSADKTNRVTTPAAAITETRLTDTLADVERTIQSIRQRRAALTNSAGIAKP